MLLKSAFTALIGMGSVCIAMHPLQEVGRSTSRATGFQSSQAQVPAIAPLTTSPRTTTVWSDARPGFFSFGDLAGARKAEQEIQQAAKSLRQADSSTEKREAEDKLRSLLADDYDSRLDGYAEHLDELEKSLADMRAKLKRRREAKSEMIDLRVKVLIAEADDLGWPSRVRENSRYDAFPARVGR